MATYFSNAKRFVGNNIKNNSKWYAVLSLVAFLGIVIGIYSTVSGGVAANIFSGKNSASVFDFVSGDTNGFGLFFYYFLRILLACVILIFLSIHIYILPLSFLYICYQGYILGVTASSLVMLSGFAGAINTLFFLLPINLLSLAALFVLETALINRLFDQRKYRQSFFYSYSKISHSLLLAFLIIIISGLLYAVVYPLIFKSIIVVAT